MNISNPEILYAFTMLILPGMIIDYIIRLTSSREVANSTRIWYWCGYSLIPSYLTDLLVSSITCKFVLSVILALVFGYVLAYVKQRDLFSKLLTCLNLSTRTNLKTSWEYAFIHRNYCFVVVHLTNGQIYRGYYGSDSHVSDYYEQLDLFLENVYTYEENIGWVLKEELDGVYIPYKEIQAIEFIKNEQSDK